MRSCGVVEDPDQNVNPDEKALRAEKGFQKAHISTSSPWTLKLLRMRYCYTLRFPRYRAQGSNGGQGDRWLPYGDISVSEKWASMLQQGHNAMLPATIDHGQSSAMLTLRAIYGRNHIRVSPRERGNPDPDVVVEATAGLLVRIRSQTSPARASVARTCRPRLARSGRLIASSWPGSHLRRIRAGGRSGCRDVAAQPIGQPQRGAVGISPALT
jgi:hypothetical protein